MNEKFTDSIKFSLRLMWEQLRKHPIAVTIMVGTAVANSAFYVIEPYILKLFVDTLTAENLADDAYQQALTYVGWLAAVYFTQTGLWHIGARSLIYGQIAMLNGLYIKAYGYLQEHSVRFFSDSFSGSLVKRITRAVDGSERMMDNIWFTFLPVTSRLLFMVVVLIFYSPLMFIVLFGGIIIFVGFTLLMVNRWSKLEAVVIRSETKLSGTLVDAIANNWTVKVFAQEVSEAKRVKAAANTLRTAQNRSWTYFWTYLNLPQGIIWSAVLVGTLFTALYLWNLGRFSVGDIIFIETYLFTLGPLLWETVNRFQEFKEASINMAELQDAMETKHEIQDIANAKPLISGLGKIEFNNVRFAYSGTDVFKNLSFTIQSGEKVAFVGHSGSGKSTIVKLLFRLYDIQGGSILLDNQNIAEVTQQSLRNQLGIVPQDPILFHRSILENIAYGNSKSTMKDVEQAARKAHAHEFIRNLPKGYKTLVGERGVKLSGGERQRVAIARTFLENAPVVVFDEATSSLDSVSEQYIQDALDELMKDRTVIVIAHRLSTVVKMDRIIVFDQGKIVEQGTHQELLNKSAGQYKKLWEIQTQSI